VVLDSILVYYRHVCSKGDIPLQERRIIIYPEYPDGIRTFSFANFYEFDPIDYFVVIIGNFNISTYRTSDFEQYVFRFVPFLYNFKFEKFIGLASYC